MKTIFRGLTPHGLRLRRSEPRFKDFETSNELSANMMEPCWTIHPTQYSGDEPWATGVERLPQQDFVIIYCTQIFSSRTLWPGKKRMEKWLQSRATRVAKMEIRVCRFKLPSLALASQRHLRPVSPISSFLFPSQVVIHVGHRIANYVESRSSCQISPSTRSSKNVRLPSPGCVRII
jgi:hypothetical protein